ncbi:MAG: hypothetical protein K8S94_14900 [Planctomycetia bacterium]|nr:hypothetical protein [Planctomycetia bacterium]
MALKSDVSGECLRVCRDFFADLGTFTISRGKRGNTFEGILERPAGNASLVTSFAIGYRRRVTPQIAGNVLDSLAESISGEPEACAVLYAPVISPRVAELARERGVSFIDGAGNGRISAPASALFIERSGRMDPGPRRVQRSSDPFAPRSSRIIRAMLHEPARAWQMAELADHPDVGVSIGLVAKVKSWLISEGYAASPQRRLVLTRPADLLDAWATRFTGTAQQTGLYLRGDPAEVEEVVAAWCAREGVRYALARLSAAWRLVPDIRHSIATLYAEAPNSDHRGLIDSLRKAFGAAEVDSGANLLLLEPFDPSVFVRAAGVPAVCTSPLQTYLDLKPTKGRGAEAAEIIFDRHIRASFGAGAAGKPA